MPNENCEPNPRRCVDCGPECSGRQFKAYQQDRGDSCQLCHPERATVFAMGLALNTWGRTSPNTAVVREVVELARAALDGACHVCSRSCGG